LGRIGLKLKPTFEEFVRYIVDDFKAGFDLVPILPKVAIIG
jgi:hypothetical protein